MSNAKKNSEVNQIVEILSDKLEQMNEEQLRAKCQKLQKEVLMQMQAAHITGMLKALNGDFGI